jgi:cytochrome c-type biogenesis protein CcmH/NrfG
MHRMATYKRRIVYLSDQEWESLTAKSKARGYTISEYVRRVLNAHEPSTSTWSAVKAKKTGEPVVLVGRPDPRQFNSRPFTPVPKK